MLILCLRRVTVGTRRLGYDVTVHAERAVLRGWLRVGRCLESVGVHWIDMGEGMHRLLGIGWHSLIAIRRLRASRAFHYEGYKDRS